MLEITLFDDISLMIEQGRGLIASHANSTSIHLFWRIEKHLIKSVLNCESADYGKQIVSQLATKLVAKLIEKLNKTN